MATSLKGQSGVKGFLLLHGEKIAIGLIGLVALWFVYKSTKLDKLDDKHQAPELRSEITKTTAEISQFTWDMAAEKNPEKIKKVVPIAAKGDFNVDVGNYAAGKSGFTLDTPVVKPVIKRNDPGLLEALAVHATGGSGLFSFVDEEIRKQQELKRETEAKEREKKEQDKAKKEQTKQGKNQPPGSPGRRGKPGDVATAEPFDPAHPKRRPVEGSVRPAGIQLQGGERIERAYWACVVAKVPIKEQLKIFQDAFAKALPGIDPSKDFPHYVGYLVDRAEVIPGKELEWKRVPLYDAQRKSIPNSPISKTSVNTDSVQKLFGEIQKYWAGGPAPDIVDPRFEDPVLTLPLPPLVGRDWGPEVCHPDIPLNPPPLENETPAAAVAPEQPTSTDEFNSTGAAQQLTPLPGAMQGRSFGPGPGFMRGPGGHGPEGAMIPPGGARAFGPGPGSMGPGPEGGRSMAGPGVAPGQQSTLAKGVDYWLLRFFDYTVEPGKKYKYRVKLVLADPNFGQPPAVLSPAVLDRQAKEKDPKTGIKPYRMVEKWSDPSPTVAIPLAGNVRLADVKIPSSDKVNDEPSAALLVDAFDADEKGNAIQAAVDTSESAHKKDFHRGHVANLVEDTEYIVYEEGGNVIDTRPGFKFMTGMTLLDIDGGTKLTRDMNAPASILVMGPAGELYIHHELDDKPFVDFHRALFEKTGSTPGRGRYGPGPAGPEGPGGPGSRGPVRAPSGARSASLPKR